MTITYTPPLFSVVCITFTVLAIITAGYFAFVTCRRLRNRWLNVYWLYHTTKIDCFHNISLNCNIDDSDKKMLRDNFRLKMPSPYVLFTLKKPFTLNDYFTAKEVAFFTDPTTDWGIPKDRFTVHGSSKFNTPAAEHLSQINKPLSFLDRKPKVIVASSHTVKYPACHSPISLLVV
ncbi:hypothetical protein ACFSYG_12005 [Leeuwenhoekiella polynyae]|uniref:Uncharacterized protein n=1 Tax=Leeuwenhoekiella polynyae TaxID=1550906 RepID=A0A4Q0PFS5_9FLAO|nr:hypothetical protein [Leeuwenhoekiella polynyae]RXG25681.1 hypothetical protein DSM02_848 [Leeuwenhoekiella polynyae]